MKKKKLQFWELKEGMYVGVDITTRTNLDDDDTPLKLNGRVVGVIKDLKNDRAIVRLASGGSLVIFNTGYLSDKENRTFPYDVDEITEAEYLIDKV